MVNIPALKGIHYGDGMAKSKLVVPAAVAPVVLIVRSENWSLLSPVSVAGAKVAVAPDGSPTAVRLTVHEPFPLNSTMTELVATVP